MSSDAVLVAVRVRPFNTRERDLKSKLVVSVGGDVAFARRGERGRLGAAAQRVMGRGWNRQPVACTGARPRARARSA
jgi:hypothetical protein